MAVMSAKGAWAEPLTGQVLGQRYRLDRLIGAGGMGAVFEGTHVRVGHRVAVKLIAPKIATSPEFLERFHQEARAAASVTSTGVVQVLDFDTDPHHGPYLVMEHLAGETLSSALKKNGKLGLDRSVWIVSRILATLSAVHARGIVHRDLKPDNVFIAREHGSENVKVLDFGISRVQRPPGKTALTMPGSLLGTPRYMAPEQARAQMDVDHRVDVYAAGAMLYVCLGGRPPYAGTHGDHVLAYVIQGPPDPLPKFAPEIPMPLVAVVEKAMARNRNERFATAQEMLDALGAAHVRISTPSHEVLAPAEPVPMTRVAETPESRGISRPSFEVEHTPVRPGSRQSMPTRPSGPSYAPPATREATNLPYVEPPTAQAPGISHQMPMPQVAAPPKKRQNALLLALVVGGVGLLAFGVGLGGIVVWLATGKAPSPPDTPSVTPMTEMPTSSDADLETANQALSQGRLDDAERIYRTVADHYANAAPGTTEARARGVALLGLGQVTLAPFERIPSGQSFGVISMTYQQASEQLNRGADHLHAAAALGDNEILICTRVELAKAYRNFGAAIAAYGVAPSSFVDPMLGNAETIRSSSTQYSNVSGQFLSSAIQISHSLNLSGPCVDRARSLQ